MEREMRRFRQKLTDEESVDLLRRATSGVLSLCGKDMRPYGVPLSHVFHEGKIYFHSALNGHKLELIRENENVSFTVIAEDEIHPEKFTTYFRSVIAFGTMKIIDDELCKKGILKVIGERFNPEDKSGLTKEIISGLSRCYVLEMTIERITGKQAIELVK